MFMNLQFLLRFTVAHGTGFASRQSDSHVEFGGDSGDVWGIVCVGGAGGSAVGVAE